MAYPQSHKYVHCSKRILVLFLFISFQDLNISVDYYGNVKLSIQGLPMGSAEGK